LSVCQVVTLRLQFGYRPSSVIRCPRLARR